MTSTCLSPEIRLRMASGRKATRTSTAPSVLKPEQRGSQPNGRRWEQRCPFGRILQKPGSRYASQDNGSQSWNSSGGLSPNNIAKHSDSGSSSCLVNVKEVFAIKQVMRDTLETRRRPRESTKTEYVHQRHKKEFLRSWSRERTIVTEEIIYPLTNLSVTSAGNSFLNVSSLGKRISHTSSSKVGS